MVKRKKSLLANQMSFISWMNIPTNDESMTYLLYIEYQIFTGIPTEKAI